MTLCDPVTIHFGSLALSSELYEQEKMPHIFHDKVVQKINIYKNCTQHKPVEACLMVIFPQIKKPTSYHNGQCTRVRLEVDFYYHYIGG